MDDKEYTCFVVVREKYSDQDTLKLEIPCDSPTPSVTLLDGPTRDQNETVRVRRGSFQKILARYGYFVQIHYHTCSAFCPELSAQDLARLVLMATLKNSKDRFSYKTLAVGRDAASRTFRSLEQYGYLSGKRDPGYIPDTFATMGRIDKKMLRDMTRNGEYVIRLFCSAYQTLYASVPSRLHVWIGYLLRLLPWMDRKYNVICANPNNTDLYGTALLTGPDISEIVGKGRKKSYLLFDTWEPLRIFSHGELFPVIKKIDVAGRKGYAINPRLMYGGPCIDNADRFFRYGMIPEGML